MSVNLKNGFKLGLGIFILYLCIHYFDRVVSLAGIFAGAAFPLLVGCIIAYFVNILMSFYERRYFPNSKKKLVAKSRKPVCMIGAFLTLLAIIVLVISLIVPQLVSCVQLIAAELPGAIAYVIERVSRFNIIPENITETLYSIDWKSRVGDIVNTLSSGVGNVMDVVVNLLSSVFSGIVAGFLGVIFAIYLLLSKDKLRAQLVRLERRFLPEKAAGKVKYVLATLNDCFHKYIVGQCTEAVILGVLCTLGMLILRLPYATMIGALVAFTALIPIAGAYIGAGIGAFMILTVSPVQALIFLVFIVVLQQLEGNLIYPKVVGSSIGLPGIWVLAAVTVGGGVMGIPGMLLGVPIAAAIYRMLRDKVNEPQLSVSHES